MTCYPNPQVAENIYALVRGSKLTSMQIAKRLGIGKNTLYQYIGCVSSPNAEVIRKICGLFRVSADELLFGVIGGENT